jgi:UPF0755 protein
VFLVPAGQGTGQIATRLAAEGLIRSELGFRLWARWTGNANRLRAGEYLLSPSMGTRAIMDKLATGQVILYPVTIPEGYNLSQIKGLLVAKGFADADRFDRAVADAVAQGIVPVEMRPAQPQFVIHQLEGYLFPETYRFHRGISEAEIIRAMVGQMRTIWTEQRLARARELKLSVAQALTLASIIEREARLAEERPLIAGVFHNRLRLQMALGADPTVRYVLSDPNRRMTVQQMREVQSPYNTYNVVGLPPGPICSPGLASIDAALNPLATDYLYFVAKKDGSHAFARTLAEHSANIRRYPP